MAALVAGVQYGLSSRNSNENTSLIFVKLTDSAFRAIEEYLRNVDRTGQKPTIQFRNNEGHLSIPSAQQSSRGSHVFNFSLSSTADEGTFECLQRTSGSHAVDCLGPLSHQMWVQANDDVYETTRHRMAVAEEQHKKNCTRVIKPNTADIGRKVKLKPGVTAGRESSPSSNHVPRSLPPMLPSPYQRLTQNTSQQHSRAMSNNHAQKPGNPELMRRPIRERLIHLLAVRPYKKPELYDRIHRDGLRDRDKKMVTQTLSQVAVIRDNTYHLLRSIWNDVQEDWPFYTEQDRQMLKRRKPQNLTPPGSSDTGSSGSGQSPTSTHPGSPPPAIQAGPKRPGYFESADGIQSKRQRISHFTKPPGLVDPTPYGQEDVRAYVNASRDFVNANATREFVNGCRDGTSESSPGLAPPPPLRKRSDSPATVTSTAPGGWDKPSVVSTRLQDDKIQENTVSASSEIPDYLTEYTTIVDDAQRRKYKVDFNAHYEEYKKLHATMETVSQKFSELDAQLRKATPGSPEYRYIKNLIYKEYQDNQKNEEQQRVKRKFNYLHEKLSHIKQLVAEYDATTDY